MLISHFQAKLLMQAKKAGASSVKISLDLGKTSSEVEIKTDRFIFPGNVEVDEKKIKKVIKKDTSCFFIRDNDIQKVEFFSEKTDKYYKLFPTSSWPTIEISGIRMHCVKSITPKQDTEMKISFIEPCIGKVLDTCTGLGYTAIEASKRAEEVYTYEIDEAVAELQKINPYSEGLFKNNNIIRSLGDVFIEIRKLRNEFFDRIIHDPPRLSLATLLYSQEFYNSMFRVLKRPGKIFHYTGSPGSKYRKVDLKKGVMRRMGISGFCNLKEVFNGITGEKR